MVQKITRSLMCCVLFALHVVAAYAADKLMIVGDAVWGGWTPANSVVMLPAGDNVFKATVFLKKVDGVNVTEGFKLLTAPNWDCLQYHAGDNNVVLGNDMVAPLYDNVNNSSDKKFQVTEDANYDVVCDLTNMTITATKSTYQEYPVNHNTLWMVGSATSGGWDFGRLTELKQDAENPVVFKATTYFTAGEMKIAHNNEGGYDQTFYQKDTADPSKMVLGGDDNKWEITEAGTYDVEVNLADMTISMKKHYADFAVNHLFLMGDAVWSGWEFANSTVLFPDENGDFKATLYLEADKNFKLMAEDNYEGLQFRAGDDDVTLQDGTAATLVSSEVNRNDKQFKVSESANYDIVCNVTNGTITVVKSEYQENPIKHNALWMVGDATPDGWSVGGGIQVNQNAENPMVYKTTTYLNSGEFKFAVNKYMGFNQTYYTADATDATKVVFGGEDNKWQIAEAGTYDVELNLVDMTMSVKKHYADFTVDHLFLMGDAIWSGWDFKNSTVLLPNEAGICKATLYLEAQKGFKLMAENDFNGLQFRAGDEDVTLLDGTAATLVSSEVNRNDNKFMVSESANYDIVCDLNNKTITVAKSAYQAAQAKHAELWMIGDAVTGDYNLWNGVQMNQDAENPMVYTATANLNQGELKFAVNKYMGFDQTFYVKGADDTKVEFGGEDNKWQIAEAGTYDVELNLADMTISIVKKGTTGISSVNADVTAPVEYFTVDGKRVNNVSAKGLYIKRQNGKTTKVMIAE